MDGPRDEGAEGALESLLFQALERRANQGDAGMEAFLAEHREHASALRDEIAKLARVGLLPGGEAAREMPERLGDFQLIARLGEGGMGVVYAARQVSLGRPVALKLLRPDHVWFPGARERFRREIESLARLQHPGIVPIYAVGEEAGVPCFAMELFDGATLAQVLEHLHGRDPARLSGADLASAVEHAANELAHGLGDAAMPSAGPAKGSLFEASWLDASLRIARQIAEALEHVHSRGIVHRDVKPSNIALTRSGRAMLFDFGLAHAARADRLTRTGQQPGSLPYMAPEQIDGREADARSDVYALGVTLYELVTLRPAFDADSSELLRARVVRGEFERPSHANRALFRDVETVCLTAMERDPSRRYATAEDFARDLGHLIGRRPIEASRTSPFLRALRWAQRRPRASTAIAAAIPLALAGLVALAWLQKRALERESGLRTQAQAQREELLRLADVRRLDDLRAEADRLWPPLPDLADPLAAWLSRADELIDRVETHRATLASWRSSPDARQDAQDAWRFATTEEQWRHDTLAVLVDELDALAQRDQGLYANVSERQRFAETIAERSLEGDEARRRWDEAIASIANREQCPLYDGLAIGRQLGLLPVGRDPLSGLWEFAHLQSGEPAQRDRDGTVLLEPRAGIVLVLLPGGTFRMGSDGDPLQTENEVPAHEVTLAPFFLAKYPVTQAQWERLTGSNPSSWKPGYPGEPITPLHPVEGVSWTDCHLALERCALVLPTEAQWEYGARGGTRTRWWTGDDPESLRGAANIADAFYRDHGGPQGMRYEDWLDDGYAFHSPVNAHRANPFGLHDVTGNVYQWCRDSYGTYHDTVAALDGERLVEPSGFRCYRGGSCGHAAVNARAADRSASESQFRAWFLGVRPARRVDP